jgi:hypothetical protein
MVPVRWMMPVLLDRARELERVLFTRDDELLTEAATRQRAGRLSGGVIYTHQCWSSIGRCVQDLAISAESGEPADLMNSVMFPPL